MIRRALRRGALWGAGLLLIATGLIGQARVGPGGWVDVTAQSGALLAALGFVWEVLDRTSASLAYRNGLLLAAGTTLLLVVANGAVGIAGAADDDVNRIYLGVVAMALGFAAIGRLRPGAMRRGMGICAMMVLIAGLSAFLEGVSDLVEAFAIHLALASPYFAAEALFRRAETYTKAHTGRPEAVA
jgi:hypothetical protein